MTVKDLIKLLLEEDQDSKVYLLADCEDGREMAIDVTGICDAGFAKPTVAFTHSAGSLKVQADT